MNTGSVLAQFTITLTQAVSEPVLVDWYTSDGTAKAGVDYAAGKGIATFAPGETSKTISILVYGRAVGSEDRSFFVEMLPPVNAILGASIGECIIHVDTTGSTPVTQVIVPTGPRGIQGKSAYQVWLDLGNTGTEQDFIDSLSPPVDEIAAEVAPLIDVGNTTLTAQGTELLGRPDATTVKAVARRVAYVGPAKIATVLLADGDNLVASSSLSGDAVDFGSAGLYPRIFRGGTFLVPVWSLESNGSLFIKSAVAGDVLYVCQYDVISSEAVINSCSSIDLKARDGLRRALADSGYTLVDGSFERGAVVHSSSDAVLYEKTGESYSYDGAIPSGGIAVPKYSSPSTAGGIGVGHWLLVSKKRTATLSQAIAEYCGIGTKYEISDAGKASVLVVASSDTGGFYYGNNAAGHKLKLIFDGTITAKNMMMVPGVGADNSAKLAQLNNFEWSNLLIEDRYEFTSNVEISKPGKKITISGNGTLAGVGAYLTVSGSITPYGVITAADAKGGRTVSVADASGIEVGDTVCIHNQNTSSFSARRPEYTAGEFNTVIAKAGNQLTLKNRLMFNYTGLTGVKLFKMNLVKLVHDRTNISTTGASPYAMRVKFGDVTAVGRPNVTAKGTTACAAALVYDKCPNVTFDLGDVYNDTVGSSTQYGISFSSCWNAVGYAKSAWGYRHGITSGGDAADCSIPCLNILVKDGTVIGNDPASGIYAADFHGNTIDSYYRDCVIYGDIGLAGENVGCPGSTIYAQRANYPIDLHEIVGGIINLDGVKIKPLPAFNFSELIGFSASSLAAKVDRAFTVRAHGISCQLTSAVQRIFNLLFNQASAVSGKSVVDVDGVSLSGDQSGLVEIARLIQQAPGIRPDLVRIKGLPRLTDAQKYLSLSGTFQGCVVSLPSVTSQLIALTITGGGWFSSAGGVGGYALHSFPHYPIAPQAVAVVENQVRAESPKVHALIESVGTNNITAYLATSNSSLTIPSGSTKNVRLTAMFENMVMP